MGDCNYVYKNGNRYLRGSAEMGRGTSKASTNTTTRSNATIEDVSKQTVVISAQKHDLSPISSAFDDEKHYNDIRQQEESGKASIIAYADTIYKVTAGENGEIIFNKSYGKQIGGSRNLPLTEHEDMKAYYIVMKNENEPVQRGINWNNVKSVSGKVYDIKDDLKRRGFKWNGDTKRWERP